MAKGKGNNNNRNRNNRDNYFSKNIRQYSENFLEGKDLNTLLRDAKIIFRDIAYGNIDYQRYFPYFQNPQLLNALVSAANEEAFEAQMICCSIDTWIQTENYNGRMIDNRVMALREKWGRKYQAYYNIQCGLASFMQYPIPENLLAISKSLFPLRYDL